MQKLGVNAEGLRRVEPIAFWLDGHLRPMLCRLLGLAPEAQGQIFDLYQAVLEASIQRARKEGKYDEGIVDVKGTAVTLAQPPQVILPPPVPTQLLTTTAPAITPCLPITPTTSTSSCKSAKSGCVQESADGC